MNTSKKVVAACALASIMLMQIANAESFRFMSEQSTLPTVESTSSGVMMTTGATTLKTGSESDKVEGKTFEKHEGEMYGHEGRYYEGKPEHMWGKYDKDCEEKGDCERRPYGHHEGRSECYERGYGDSDCYEHNDRHHRDYEMREDRFERHHHKNRAHEKESNVAKSGKTVEETKEVKQGNGMNTVKETKDTKEGSYKKDDKDVEMRDEKDMGRKMEAVGPVYDKYDGKNIFWAVSAEKKDIFWAKYATKKDDCYEWEGKNFRWCEEDNHYTSFPVKKDGCSELSFERHYHRCDDGSVIVRKPSGTYYERSATGDNSFQYSNPKDGRYAMVSQSGAYIFRDTDGNVKQGAAGSLNAKEIEFYAHHFHNRAAYEA